MHLPLDKGHCNVYICHVLINYSIILNNYIKINMLPLKYESNIT